jgi:hypothetical protein
MMNRNDRSLTHRSNRFSDAGSDGALSSGIASSHIRRSP